jgi:hypothetical protein
VNLVVIARRFVALARRFLVVLAWIVVAVAISLGAAGVIAAMDHVPATGDRPELTWAGDQAAIPALDAATVQLASLSDAVDQLATTARRSLTDVVAGDTEALGGTIDAGTLQVTQVRTEAARLVASLGSIPGVGERAELRLSPVLIERYQALYGTQGLTSGLEADWLSFTGRAVDASRLTAMLTRHDAETAAAAREGAAGHYRRALTLLDIPDATLADARALRDDLATTTDVGTLTAWLDRNATYDAALRELYRSLSSSGGRVTRAVRNAFDGEAAARAQLPADTRGLVVIMNDIAQGGLNQAVISIEQARGSLADALDLQQRYQAGEAGGSAAPDGSAAP